MMLVIAVVFFFVFFCCLLFGENTVDSSFTHTEDDGSRFGGDGKNNVNKRQVGWNRGRGEQVQHKTGLPATQERNSSNSVENFTVVIQMKQRQHI